METNISLQEIYQHPLVAEIIDQNRELRQLSDKPDIKDLKDIPLPYTVKNHVCINEGVHNGTTYTAQMLRMAVDQHEGLPLFLEHDSSVDQGGTTKTWIGELHNPRWSEADKAILADIDFVDPKYAMAIAYGAKFGISATVDVDVVNDSKGREMANDPIFKSYALVIDPAVRETMLNENTEEEFGGSKEKKMRKENQVACKPLDQYDIPERVSDYICQDTLGYMDPARCGFAGSPDEWHEEIIRRATPRIASCVAKYNPQCVSESEFMGCLNQVEAQMIAECSKRRPIGPGRPIGPVRPGRWPGTFAEESEMYETMNETMDELKPALAKVDDAIRRASAMKDASLLTSLQQLKAMLSKLAGTEYPYPKPGKTAETEGRLAALEQLIYGEQISSEHSGSMDPESLLKENEKMKEQLNAIEHEKLVARADGILKKELELGLVAAADTDPRRKELEAMDVSALGAVEQNLDKTIKILETDKGDSKPDQSASGVERKELSASQSSSAALLKMMTEEQSKGQMAYGGAK